ncbi:DEAD/DEAH box helicase [Lederbergia citrea]|uniref:DEAD/DEAH box helicase n=1 Tax=Lederbergia citrea TaxID=2833581 RepID=UPI001BCA0C43|nr:DEAD/DEAH box helicase [Lederbergia citrea]MBS4179289.1 DEAD/DEAH box helicase [Lederbergia citrea]
MTTDTQFLSNIKPQLQNLWEKSGFESPTAIQSEAIPFILQRKDLVAESPTGTGKTVAYLIPILNQIQEESKSLQAVILAPSRELVMQIYQEVQKWTEGTAIVGASLVGGANIKRQLDKLKERPQIVVGTPGRILELIKLRKLKMHEVQTIVLDEGDQLLVKEHLETVRTIVKSTMNDRQLLLFSATAVKDIDQVIAMIGRMPEKIKISRNKDTVSATVDHCYLLCEPRDKAKLLQKIAAMDGVKALVFVRSVGSMTVLAEKLKYEGVSLEMLHSEMRKSEREKSLSALRDSNVKVLLATDVAARGLDIEGLTHVIHYDFPEDTEQYIHRSGRTGRMGATGTVVSLISEREERELKKIGRELKLNILPRRIFKGQLVEVNRKK